MANPIHNNVQLPIPTSKRSRRETDISPNDFFKRTKINLDIINLSRSYLCIADFKSTLRVCKEWNGYSLKEQYCRYMSAVPARAKDILHFACFIEDLNEIEPNSDTESTSSDNSRGVYITCKSFKDLSDSWKEAFFLGISKVKSIRFFEETPKKLRLSILKNPNQLKGFSTVDPTIAEIQALAKIPHLKEVKVDFSEDEFISDFSMNFMPLFRNDSLKKLELRSKDEFFKNEKEVDRYAKNLEYLKITIEDWINDELEGIPEFTSIIKKIPSLKVLILEMEHPCLAEFIDSLTNLQEMQLSYMQDNNVEALSKAHSLEKLTLKNCFQDDYYSYDTLYNCIYNLPKLKTIHFICDCIGKFGLTVLNISKFATIAETTIISGIDQLPTDLRMKKIFLYLDVYEYSDLSINNPTVISLKKNPNLMEIHLNFMPIPLNILKSLPDPNENQKEFIIAFFKEFAQKIKSISGIPNQTFIKEYLKKNPLPNCLIEE